MSDVKESKYLCRKISGIIWLVIEVNLLGGTIFGFPALFKVLANDGIYNASCVATTSSNQTEETECKEQTNQYQNALTLGIVFFDVPSMFVGALIDKFGCRFVKLIAVVFHVVGWLSLALLQPGRDYLLYLHTVFSSFAGITVLVTSYAFADYFSKSRAFVSTLFAGACTSASIWYSIFQVLIDSGRIHLRTLSYIWVSIGLSMITSAFLHLDWKFSCLNLPYQFNTAHENRIDPGDSKSLKWYQKIRHRKGVWKYITSPMYILVVLFLSILLMPSVFLTVTWYPWVFYITNRDVSSTKNYTFAFNLSTLAALIICPIHGYLLGFHAEKSREQKLFNISIAQTISWVLNIVCCVLCMFVTRSVIIPALVINCFARATIVAGSQAVVATFFPSEYIGTLTGLMWTIAGLITFIQYGLVKLTYETAQSWRAWTILLALIVLMSCHLIQIWMKFIRERRKATDDPKAVKIRF